MRGKLAGVYEQLRRASKSCQLTIFALKPSCGQGMEA